MEVTPCLGIGDILLLKKFEVSKQITIKKIHISRKLLIEYRKYPEKNLEFVQKFIACLFPSIPTDIVDTPVKPIDFNKYRVDTPYIYDKTTLAKQMVVPPYQNYIIFHTKVRMENMDHFLKKDLMVLKSFLKTFKVPAHQTILLMGERVIEECKETKLLHIVSIYQELLALSANNKVVDLTKETLYSGNPDFKNFTDEINLIHHADLNVTFGLGGNTNLCYAFSQRNIAFMGPLKIYVKLLKNYHHIYQTIEPFIKHLQSYINGNKK